jgi:hypothetical protein
MENNYFGKLDNSFILYIDPIHFDILNFSKNFSTVYCNKINYANSEDNIHNSQLDLHTFIEKIKGKTISEFDLIFDDEIQIQNIWWDNLLVISNLDN